MLSGIYLQPAETSIEGVQAGCPADDPAFRAAAGRVQSRHGEVDVEGGVLVDEPSGLGGSVGGVVDRPVRGLLHPIFLLPSFRSTTE
jgi:hypothetical protein